MEPEIIPAINVDSFEEVRQRIKLVEPFVKWVQLDVAEGTFTKNTTWHNAPDLLGLETPLKIEVHLMISNIEERFSEWLLPEIDRIIFHLETSQDPNFVIEKIHVEKKEVGIAIAPGTPWTRLAPYLKKVDLIQILGVHPGLASQEFQEECLDKIVHLKKECPKCIIEVDGGMNKAVAKKAVKAGADIIVVASAIFSAPDIKKAIDELKHV